MKKSYILDRIEQNKSNIKKLWKNIKLLIPNQKGKNSPTLDLPDCTSNKDIANEFNRTVCEIGSTLAALIEDVDVTKLPDLISSGNIFTFQEVTVNEIAKALTRINVTKATGLDGINARFLKLAAEYIAVPLAHIVNMSLKCSVVPLDWKIARVSPLYKDGSRNLVTNYRPCRCCQC